MVILVPNPGRAVVLTTGRWCKQECRRFVEAITRGTRVHSLDLSRNLIGQLEIRNVVTPGFVTGGEAIASALEQPNALIRVLVSGRPKTRSGLHGWGA
jgi:hypothetical protein